MQVVIDIPDEAYELLKRKSELDNIAESIIANGIPMPEGHGRLIDADKYRHEWVDTFDSCYGDKCSILFKMSVDNAQTIIEADK